MPWGSGREGPAEHRDSCIREPVIAIRRGDQLLGLAAVETEQRGQRHEHVQAQGGERPAVGVGADTVGRRREARGGERDRLVVVEGPRHLEVDELHVALGRHEDVARVEVAVGDPSFMQPFDRRRHPRDDVERPVAVGAMVVAGGIGPHLRRPPGHRFVERRAGDVVEHEEQVVADRDDLAHPDDGGLVRQPRQHVGFVAQTGDGIPPVRGEARVRAGLLEDHGGAGMIERVSAIDPARVAEVQGFADAVAERRGRCGIGHRAHLPREELRHVHPRGNEELGGAPVGDRHARGVEEHRDGLPVHARGAGGESAVPDGEGAVVPPQVAEDVGTLVAADDGIQVGQRAFELVDVTRVEREELAGRAPVRLLAVAGEQLVLGGDELEADPVLPGVGRDRGEQRRRPGGRRRSVDLPALVGERGSRMDAVPAARGALLPGRPVEVERQPVATSAESGNRRRRFVEERIGQVVHRPRFHVAHSCIGASPSGRRRSRPQHGGALSALASTKRWNLVARGVSRRSQPRDSETRCLSMAHSSRADRLRRWSFDRSRCR